MGSYLKMPDKRRVLALLELGWSYRRIERRMAVHKCATLADYAAFLRAGPEEPGLLMKELLISVTNFFRDVEAWQALSEKIIPKLFEDKDIGNTIRAWTIGCATGEEWATWKAHPTHFASGEHMFFSVRNKEGSAPDGPGWTVRVAPEERR